MKKYFLLFTFFIALLLSNRVFAATGTVLKTNFWNAQMNSICSNQNNCYYFQLNINTQWDYDMLYIYNTKWDLLDSYMSYWPNFKILVYDKYIFFISRSWWLVKVTFFKDWNKYFYQNTLDWAPTYSVFDKVYTNWNIIYLYNSSAITRAFKLDTTNWSFWLYNLWSIPAWDYLQSRYWTSRLWTYKNVLIWNDLFNIWTDNLLKKSTDWVVTTFFNWFIYTITDFNIINELNNYVLSFITNSVTSEGKNIFTYKILKSNLSVTFLWFDFWHFIDLLDWQPLVYTVSYINSNINLWKAPLAVFWWKNLTLNYFHSYVNSANNLVSNDFVVSSWSQFNPSTNFDDEFITWSWWLFNIDIDGDGSISLVEGTLAPFTIIKNVIIKLYESIKNFWLFLKSIMEIWNISFIPETYASNNDPLQKVLNRTDQFYSSWANNANNIHDFVIMSQWGFYFLIFFIILSILLLALIKR